jgi:hypothetical protein
MTRFDETTNSWALRGTLVGATVVIAALVAGPHDAMAQAPIVYPSQGQSMEQQGADEGQCRMFAQQNTGFNPSQGPAYVGSSSQGGEMVGGAARGAALGAVGGAIGGNAGKGAAIGAGVGAVGGLMRKNKKKRKQEKKQQRAVNDYNQQLATYNRAFGACMSGRGYAVN